MGIGAVWDTKSKDLKGRRAMGPEGVGEILDLLSGTGVDAVAIGSLILTVDPVVRTRLSAELRRYSSSQPPAAVARQYIARSWQHTRRDRCDIRYSRLGRPFKVGERAQNGAGLVRQRSNWQKQGCVPNGRGFERRRVGAESGSFDGRHKKGDAYGQPGELGSVCFPQQNGEGPRRDKSS